MSKVELSGSAAVRILLIEDEVDDEELLRVELERAGLAITISRVDTEAALRSALAWGEWDVVLSDYRMPTLDGMMAFDIVHATRPELPFIFISGTLGEERAVEAMRAGARDYIVKGAHYARVCAAIRREIAVVEAQRVSALEARRSAREREAQRAAIEVTGAAIFEYDDERARVSPASAVRWISESPVKSLVDELVARLAASDVADWRGHVHEDDRDRLEKAVFDVRRGADRAKADLRVASPGGGWIDLQVSAHVLERDATGIVRRLVGVVLDVTERRTLEAQFRHSQRMDAIGRLAGGVAHDFNNLLTIIIGYASVATMSLDEDAELKKDLDEITSAANRAAILTRQLLTFARRQQGSARPVSPGAVLETAEGLFKHLLRENVALERSVGTRVWNVHVDPNALEQVLMNLVVNARDAMPEGGRIRVTVDNRRIVAATRRDGRDVAPGDYVSITVSDSGHGMDEATRARIFEPFFTTKPAGKGTGLGLSVCADIVAQTGGHIFVESAIGRGATFEVLLPRTHRTVAQAEESRAPRTLRGTERVLVVEDDDQLRELALRALGDFGYQARGAPNGQLAWQLVGDGAMRVDLIVSDLGMEQMSGEELGEHVRSMRQPPRMLYMSGHGESIEGEGTGGRLLLRKPFTPGALLEAVRDAIDGVSAA